MRTAQCSRCSPVWLFATAKWILLEEWCNTSCHEQFSFWLALSVKTDLSQLFWATFLSGTQLQSFPCRLIGLSPLIAFRWNASLFTEAWFIATQESMRRQIVIESSEISTETGICLFLKELLRKSKRKKYSRLSCVHTDRQSEITASWSCSLLPLTPTIYFLPSFLPFLPQKPSPAHRGQLVQPLSLCHINSARKKTQWRERVTGNLPILPFFQPPLAHLYCLIFLLVTSWCKPVAFTCCPRQPNKQAYHGLYL